ncbi:hypothetical protein [Nitrosococcus wardiae]|uniref:Uncharacterized protein n=1 Tax=Nitrosococcus wardiae TaxID=1814290 RepID=A0A4P7C227_9GAMM|nr:hypothetical protein [Nitrosococcus wardiae]QBQ54942.1 hypothetical protein E3U44_10755 [Nitrosococcus wardiae]
MGGNANTRKMRSLVLQRVAEKGQKRIAERIESTVTRISRFFSGNGGLTLDEVIETLDENDLKVVDKDAITISAEEYAALKLFARKGLKD